MNQHPVSNCAKCGKEYPVEELQLLPEVDAFQRAFAMSMKNGSPTPEALSDEALKEKYGYGSMDLFCEECLKKITANI